MRIIINFLYNTDLIKVFISILGLLLFVSAVMMKYYIGYSGLGVTIFYVMLFLFLFFTSVLIFFDKEGAKDSWILIGLGFLVGWWLLHPLI